MPFFKHRMFFAVLLRAQKKVEPRKDLRKLLRKDSHQCAMEFLGATTPEAWETKSEEMDQRDQRVLFSPKAQKALDL